jgi:hypothetical protein
MTRLIGIAVIASLLVAAAPAHSARVELRFVGKEDVLVGRTESRPFDIYALTYRADPGEQNRAAMTGDPLTGVTAAYQVTDPGAKFRDLPPSCGVSGPTVRCNPPRGDALIRDAYMELGDADDEAVDHGWQRRIDAGPGDDNLAVGDDFTHTAWIGGPGADRFDTGNAGVNVSYTGRPAPVSVTLDGQANDGAAGERDNVTGAPGQIHGGEADDRLAAPAATAPPGAGIELHGHGGDDELRAGASGAGIIGGAGADRMVGGAGRDGFTGGPGGDHIRGGGGRDRVEYGDSPAGVTVRLDDQGGDGAPGEGDDVRSDVEEVFGSPHADVIVGTPGDDTLLGGGAGADYIDGRSGNDYINLMGSGGYVIGGSGRDELTVHGAPHSVRLRDGEQDSLTCASVGPVAVERDASDRVQRCQASALLYAGRPRIRLGRKGYAPVPVLCAPAEGPCAGKVTLRRGGRVLGKRRYRLRPFTVKRVYVRVSRVARKRLRRSRRLRVQLVARESGRSVRLKTVTLLPPRR